MYALCNVVARLLEGLKGVESAADRAYAFGGELREGLARVRQPLRLHAFHHCRSSGSAASLDELVSDSLPLYSSQFCPACARRQYSLWSGWKRACSSALVDAHEVSSAFVRPLLALDQGAGAGQVTESALIDGKDECPAAGLLSNFSVSGLTIKTGKIEADYELHAWF